MPVLSQFYEQPVADDLPLSTVGNGTATVANGTAAVANGSKSDSNGTKTHSNGTKVVVNKRSGGLEIQLDTDDNVYNPYAHRVVKRPTTFLETFMHLLKASLGTGILAMPSAFRNAGYLLGTLGTIVAGILCTYAIHLLIVSSFKLCILRKKPCLSYPETAAAAFEEGPKCLRKFSYLASLLTKAFLVMYQVGTNCVYIVFISSNLKSVYDVYFDFPFDDVYFTLCIFPFVYALVMVRNLKLLSPFSIVATAVQGACLVAIFYYILAEAPLTLVGKEPIGSMTSIPLFFGTVLFAMEAIGVILPLESEMKNPKKFGGRYGVLNMSMVPISLLYMFVGLAGYLRFGDTTNTNGITLNLPQNDYGVQVIKLGLCLSIFICYALSNYVAFGVIFKEITGLPKIADNKKITKFILSTVLVGITFTLAMLIPNLDGLITLIGAFCLSAIGIAFPAIIHQLTFYKDFQERGKMSYFLFCFQNFMIVVIAILACVIGVYTSLKNILHHEM